MPPLNQISKEEIEKFDEKFVIKSNAGTDPLRYTDANLIKRFILASHLRLIDGMIEVIIEEERSLTEHTMSRPSEFEAGKLRQLQELIKKFHSEKENIKNENNK